MCHRSKVCWLFKWERRDDPTHDFQLYNKVLKEMVSSPCRKAVGQGQSADDWAFKKYSLPFGCLQKNGEFCDGETSAKKTSCTYSK